MENPALVADLLGRKVDILVTWTTPALVAAKKATSTMPIVGISGDPVQTGLVEGLARPGGNLTGLAILTDELELKNQQLLKEIVPGVTRVAVLWNPDNPVWINALKRLKEPAPSLVGAFMRSVHVAGAIFDILQRLRGARRSNAICVVRRTGERFGHLTRPLSVTAAAEHALRTSLRGRAVVKPPTAGQATIDPPPEHTGQVVYHAVSRHPRYIARGAFRAGVGRVILWHRHSSCRRLRPRV
jgi:hypothetical protein